MKKRPNAKKPNDRTKCLFLMHDVHRDVVDTYLCSRPNNHRGRHVEATYKSIPLTLGVAEWAEQQIDRGFLEHNDLPVINKQATNSKDCENV